MNREVLKSIDTGRIPVERLMSLLQTFTLKHSARALPDLLETADLENVTNRQFLLSVLETEVKGRNERRRKRNYSAAHFPPNIRKRQILGRIVSFLDLPYNCRKIDIGSFYYNQEDRKCRLLANNVFLCQSRSGSSPNAAGAA